jgi:hypothetical protein
MKVTAPSTTSRPINTSAEPAPPSPEKKTDSRMIAPKSAIDAAPMISWPKVVEISPASFSTGTSTPSEVAQRMIATSSGVSISPPAFRISATPTAMTNETANATVVSRSTGPRSLSNSISSPARKSTKASPIRATTSTASSVSTQPSSAGPITIPATISSTTEGSRSLGKKPSRKGAAKAMVETISRLSKDGIALRSRRRLLVLRRRPQPLRLRPRPRALRR